MDTIKRYETFITDKYLGSIDTNKEIIQFLDENGLLNLDLFEIWNKIQTMNDTDGYNYFNTLLCIMNSRINNIKYAIYAAEKVYPLFEAKYPEYEPIRTSIQSAKSILEHDTVEKIGHYRVDDIAANRAGIAVYRLYYYGIIDFAYVAAVAAESAAYYGNGGLIEVDYLLDSIDVDKGSNTKETIDEANMALVDIINYGLTLYKGIIITDSKSSSD